MKRTILTLAMIIAACGFVFGQSKAEQEIRKMFEMTADALVKNDLSALSNHFADDLTFTIADGNTYSKTQFLDYVKNTKRESLNFSDISVRPFGNTAVVNFTRTSTAVSGSKLKSNSQSRDTAMLVKNGGRWQIVALQVSNEQADNQSSGEEQAIRQTLEKLGDAMTRNDADAASNYWADNWTFIGRNGGMQTKAQRLASMKSGEPRPGAFKYEDINIRVMGNTAVVLARPTYPIKSANGQTITVNDRVTMTLMKNNGRWQIVATHSTWDNPETGDNAAVEKQLDEIMTNWGIAAGRRDAAAIGKILACDFVLKSPNGTIQTREQYLEAVKNFPSDATITGKTLKTLIMSDTAVLMGTYSATPKAGGQTANYNYTATFVRRLGRWIPISFYSIVSEQK